MSNTTIPNLPAVIALDGSELTQLVQGGVSKRATLNQVSRFLPEGPPGPPGPTGNSQFNQSIQNPIVFDNFDRPNGTINGTACSTGQIWEITGPGASFAKIVGGALYGDDAAPDSNFYAGLPYGQQVPFQAAIIRFESRGNSPASLTSFGPQSTLIAQSAGGNLGGLGEAMIHCQFSSTGWFLQWRENNGSFIGLANGHWQGGFLPDTDYAVGFEADQANSRIRVFAIGPNVTLNSGWITEASLPNYSQTRPTWQITGVNPTTDAYNMSYRAVMVGPPKKGTPALLESLYAGTAGTIRIGVFPAYTPITQWVATTNQFYRVFVQQTLGTFILSGTLNLRAVDTAGASVVASYSVFAVNGTGTPKITLLSITAFGLPVSLLRVSNDGSGNCALDLFFPNAAAFPVTVDCEFIGAAVPANFGVPLPGVSALTGGSSQVSIVAPPVPSVSGIANTNDWYSVATASSAWGQAVIDGVIDILVLRADAAVAAHLVVDVSAQFGQALIEPQIITVEGNGAISQIRLSRINSSPTFGVRLDVFCSSAATSPYTITVSLLGQGYVTLGPISLATAALATQNVIVSSPTGRSSLRANLVGPLAPRTIFSNWTDAGTATFTDDVVSLYNISSSELTTYTINLPPNPVNGTVIEVSSLASIATLTVSPNSGQSVSGMPSSMTSKSSFFAVFNTTNTTWYPVISL